MLDPNEAPEGYIAVEWDKHIDRCEFCAFTDDELACMDAHCYDTYRKDKSNVYFIKKEQTDTKVNTTQNNLDLTKVHTQDLLNEISRRINKEINMSNKSEVKQAKQTQSKPKHDPNKFKAGDKVVVYRKFNLDEVEGWDNIWVDSMDKFVGSEYIVNEVYGSCGIHLCGCSDDYYSYGFPSCALALVQTAEEIAEEKACDLAKQQLKQTHKQLAEKSAKRKESTQFTDQELQLIKMVLQANLRNLNDRIALAKGSATLAFDVCDSERKNNPYVKSAYKQLNRSKKYIRYASKKIKVLSSAQNKVKFLLGNKK